MDELINKKKSVDPISVIQKSAVEKPTNNPCNDLLTCDVAGQDTIQPSQAKLSNQISLARAQKLSLVLLRWGGQQNKGKGTGCTAIGLTGLRTSLTGSSRVLQNKAKPKMVKPKKTEIGI